jgi:hypothetical protein
MGSAERMGLSADAADPSTLGPNRTPTSTLRPPRLRPCLLYPATCKCASSPGFPGNGGRHRANSERRGPPPARSVAWAQTDYAAMAGGHGCQTNASRMDRAGTPSHRWAKKDTMARPPCHPAANGRVRKEPGRRPRIAPELIDAMRRAALRERDGGRLSTLPGMRHSAQNGPWSMAGARKTRDGQITVCLGRQGPPPRVHGLSPWRQLPVAATSCHSPHGAAYHRAANPGNGHAVWSIRNEPRSEIKVRILSCPDSWQR